MLHSTDSRNELKSVFCSCRIHETNAPIFPDPLYTYLYQMSKYRTRRPETHQQLQNLVMYFWSSGGESLHLAFFIKGQCCVYSKRRKSHTMVFIQINEEKAILKSFPSEVFRTTCSLQQHSLLWRFLLIKIDLWSLALMLAKPNREKCPIFVSEFLVVKCPIYLLKQLPRCVL